MNKIILLIFFLFSLNKIATAKDNNLVADDLFHIDQMNSYNENFALYFKHSGRQVIITPISFVARCFSHLIAQIVFVFKILFVVFLDDTVFAKCRDAFENIF